VTAHSGRIWVESEEGQGAVFHIVLPIEPTDACATLAARTAITEPHVDERVARHDRQVDGKVERFDGEALLRRASGNPALQQALARSFLRDAPQLLSRIRLALAEQDSGAAEGAAHTLATAAGIVQAERTVRLAGAVESYARRGRFTEAGEVVEQLTRELDWLQAALQETAASGVTRPGVSRERDPRQKE
jgi:HPt (histidine-containing phosphotransfer) domain-containing protein